MAAPDDMLVGLALLLLAGGLAAIGLAGLMERLPRNRWIGLRVAGIREDDAAWRTAHRAAGPSLMAAAGPPLLMGVALIAAPPDTLPGSVAVPGSGRCRHRRPAGAGRARGKGCRLRGAGEPR